MKLTKSLLYGLSIAFTMIVLALTFAVCVTSCQTARANPPQAPTPPQAPYKQVNGDNCGCAVGATCFCHNGCPCAEAGTCQCSFCPGVNMKNTAKWEKYGEDWFRNDSTGQWWHPQQGYKPADYWLSGGTSVNPKYMVSVQPVSYQYVKAAPQQWYQPSSLTPPTMGGFGIRGNCGAGG